MNPICPVCNQEWNQQGASIRFFSHSPNSVCRVRASSALFMNGVVWTVSEPKMGKGSGSSLEEAIRLFKLQAFK